MIVPQAWQAPQNNRHLAAVDSLERRMDLGVKSGGGGIGKGGISCNCVGGWEDVGCGI